MRAAVIIFTVLGLAACQSTVHRPWDESSRYQPTSPGPTTQEPAQIVNPGIPSHMYPSANPPSVRRF